MKADRDQIVAYRVAVQGLHREATDVASLAVLDIGVQEGAGEWARLAFDARLADVPPTGGYGPGQPLALVWSLRGAPHVHRRADLDVLAGALYPLSEADAAGRLNETGPSVARAGISAMEQYRIAAEAMREVVTGPTAKGAASTAATKQIPAVMRRECRACKTSHISDSAMRAPFLAAGLELQPATAPPVLQRRPKAKRPRRPDPAALRALALSYLTLLGPATIGEVAGYVEARRADVEKALDGLDEDLVEVQIGPRTAWLPPSARTAFEHPPAPELVRILAPFDPYLQARDRDVIVPDTAAHKALWPVLGRPSVLFVDGEVAGTVRPKASGRKLALVVEPFGPLPPPVWDDVEREARRVAEVRGYQTAAVQRVE